MIANAETAEVLRALAYLVISIAVLVGVGVLFSFRKRLSHIGADIKGVKLEVNAENPSSMKKQLENLTTTVTNEVKPVLEHVGKSVNGVPVGTPTLVGRVATLEEGMVALSETVNGMQVMIMRRLDGLERAARQAASFNEQLVKQIGVEVARVESKEKETHP